MLVFSILIIFCLVHRWYFSKISHFEAKSMLMQEGNISGSFLVHDIASIPSNFCLSIRCHGKVLHYLIYQPESSNEYYIHGNITFKSIPELVKYYHTHSEGICTKLVKLCQLAVKKQSETQPDRWEVKHSTVQIR